MTVSCYVRGRGLQARPQPDVQAFQPHSDQMHLNSRAIPTPHLLDRWGRSLLDLVSTPQELVSVNVGFVSLSEALDLTTPSGRALAGTLAIFAEFERDILRDRVKAGIAQAPGLGSQTSQTTIATRVR